MAYCRFLGGGRQVSVFPAGVYSSDLILVFQQKIGPQDVKNGKLEPMQLELVRRGGKRRIKLLLTIEAAEALSEILRPAIKDALARKEQQDFFMSFVFSKEVH